MNNKSFYSHLIEISYLDVELDSLDLSEKEKSELKHHVHGSIHYVALDVVLSELSEEHKKTFIDHLNKENYDELWKHLKENTQEIEEKIKTATHAVAKEFLGEIHKLKSKT